MAKKPAPKSKKKQDKADSVSAELRSAVRALQGQLATAEKKAEEWKDKARKHKSARASLEKQLASQAKAAAKAARQAVEVVTGVEAIAADSDPTTPAAGSTSPSPARKTTAKKTTAKKTTAKKTTARKTTARKTPAKKTTARTTSSRAAASIPEGTPNASWTVVQLRAAATAKGHTGVSRKSKAQLLSDLG